jgi:glutamine synthetase adenylyltransferase
LQALDELRRAGHLSEDDGDALRKAYRYWRGVTEALRMVHGSAKDLLLPEPGSEELGFLARRMRYEGRTWQDAAQALMADIEAHRERTLTVFNRRFADSD